MENGNIEFNKSILKYFMDFIETDFHKRKSPKRKIMYTNSDNLIVGCKLNKYKKIEEKLYNLLNNKIASSSLRIKKSDYTLKISDRDLEKLNGLIEYQLKSSIIDLNKKFSDELDAAIKNREAPDVIILEEETHKLIELLDMFIVDKILKENSELFLKIGIQEQDFITIKESILNSFKSVFSDKLKEAFENFRKNDNTNISEFIDFITIKNINDIINGHLSEISTNDLYIDIKKIITSKKMMDKQEFYFSFFDITYNKNKYPLFYIPIDVKESDNLVEIIFDTKMYINKKCIEFIMQDTKDNFNVTGKIEAILERIVYLQDDENNGSAFLLIKKIINELSRHFFINSDFDILNNDMNYKNDFVSITSSLYFNIFDNADEALVNDYEELLQELNKSESEISELFCEIINNFMVNEPINITAEIEDAWENQVISDKLVTQAPIPLNEEQIQILNALDNNECKYVTVQGPPGTGKSHTITAIIFDLVLKNKSVLILSDKKEALDVVEDKITQTLNQVRVGENFQNPILRLGKTGSTYNKILSQASLDNIKINHKVLKDKTKNLEEDIQYYSSELKNSIEFEQSVGDKIKIEDILRFEYLEGMLHEFTSKISIEELSNANDKTVIIDTFDLLDDLMSDDFKHNIISICKKYNYLISENFTIQDMELLKKTIVKYENYYSYCNSSSKNAEKILHKFGEYEERKINNVANLVKEYDYYDSRLFKFVFNKSKKREILNEFKKFYGEFNVEDYKNEIIQIKEMLEIENYIIEKENNYNVLKTFLNLIDYREYARDFNTVEEVTDKVKKLDFIITQYPCNFGTINYKNILNINIDNIASKEDFKCSIEYSRLKNLVYGNFHDIPISKYVLYKNELQKCVTLKTTSILDERVVEFSKENPAKAKLLKKIIQRKQKFPREDFEILKNAFPCILAGVRDYAEYIPLEPNIFDLVIIDEASQVSIAQALPALIRARKVLVLGDKKQFSNVKSSQAKTEINNEYKNSIKEGYKKSNFYNSAYSLKLENFDIKSSVLDFFESISNYQAMLYKHFRGYKEIISYSNKYFYNEKLQVMKIRGENIDSVLKFYYIEYDNKIEMIPKTNKLESDFIISELKELLADNYKGSVGIITPHTNQQKLILSELRKIPEYSDIEKTFNLKIMTFDTCQGEERDIIYYSMVANEKADTLNYVFAKDFSTMDMEEELKIRAQRLNVGFSRAKESMRFVLSKPLENFTGEIGNALRHYNNEIGHAKLEKSVDLTDKKSAMEPMVLTWFYQTEFWKNNSNNIEFQPQFELGKYLKQLDPSYEKPLYRVDFLLNYNEGDKTHKIIIEYDGFKEHFKQLFDVNGENYKDYYKEEDIYRQKVLESYGYKFLRINKFNVGNKPVKTLNDRIYELMDEKINDELTFGDIIKNEFTALQEDTKQKCIKCNRILDKKEFEDSNLKTGKGKICRECKKTMPDDKTCPICGAKLVIKNGKYGKFLGCTEYRKSGCKYSEDL